MRPALVDVVFDMSQLLLHGAVGAILIAAVCLTCGGSLREDTRDNDGDNE